MKKEENVINETTTTPALTHGLLLEDFKQNLLNLISQHTLDIQSKAVVLDYVNLQIQNLSIKQTQKEFEDYNKTINNENKENHKKEAS